MYQTIMNQKQKVHLVATGSYTNVALILKAFPNIKDNLEEIVFMGGSMNMGNVTPAAEYNFYSDPESAKSMLECGHEKLVMVPLDVTWTV